jgi:hypothetical protein
MSCIEDTNIVVGESRRRRRALVVDDTQPRKIIDELPTGMLVCWSYTLRPIERHFPVSKRDSTPTDSSSLCSVVVVVIRLR